MLLKTGGATVLPADEDVRTEAQRRYLRRFIRAAWSEAEPGEQMDWGWHIDAICEYLEAVIEGEILKLIINIPPRHMKSLSTAVFWPAWAWIDRPWLKWVFASYARELASTHSMACRRLIESDWYQHRWGDRFQLAVDENRKMRFENNQGGARHATSVGGTVTGMGGHIRVYDDPHKIEEVESEEQRKKVCTWHDETMSTRIAGPPEKAAEVVIMQRLHEGDLTGHLLEKGGWEHLCLPAQYEPRHPFVWPDDPRTEAGDVLWQPRWTREALAGQLHEMGSFGYAGQYQQRPTPAAGGILHRDWWRYYSEPPDLQEVVQSWDCAFKDTDDSDYVVGQVWGRDLERRYLLAQIRGHLSFPETKRAVKALDEWVRERWADERGSVLIEDKANGTAVISEIKRTVGAVLPVEPKGGKESRAHAIAPSVEAGEVYLPSGHIPAPPTYEETPTDRFLQEATSFPRGMHDDQVDACTQALIRMKRGRRQLASGGGYDKSKIRRRR